MYIHITYKGSSNCNSFQIWLGVWKGQFEEEFFFYKIQINLEFLIKISIFSKQ